MSLSVTTNVMDPEVEDVFEADSLKLSSIVFVGFKVVEAVLLPTDTVRELEKDAVKVVVLDD